MPSSITPELVYELTSLSGPSLSPDGTLLAYTRSRVDKQAMESRSRVMVMRVADGEESAFTGGPRDSRPRFSPDGTSIAFLRRDDKETRQLWVIATSGGEARQLTSAPGGVHELSWAPDSSALAFASDVDPDRPPDGHDPKRDPRVRVASRIRYRADTLGWRGDAFRHLFVTDVLTGDTRQLTDGEGDDSSPVWCPDGTSIAFISDRGADRDLVSRNEAYVVSSERGEPQQWSQGLSTVAALAWSPNGERLAVIGSDDDEVGAMWQGSIFVLAPGEGPRRLTDDSMKPAAGFAPVMPPPEMRWTADGRLLHLADRGGESFLCELSFESGHLRLVAGGGALLSDVSFDASAQRAVVLAVPPDSSGDLRLVEIDDGSDRRLTSCNEQYFEEHPAANVEKFTVARQGMEVESRLLKPPGFDPSQKYPLVVDIHGGPHGAFYDAFNPVQQVLATAGYLVLAVNPRGSSTYGVDFVKAVLRDWGGEGYLDIMRAVDEACARPYVDADRLGVTGYSYGGYMAAWIIGHDSRFGAAVVGAPCTDLASMYGTSDIGVRFGEPQWGGRRGEALSAYLERSPLTYADGVETPALLLHGEDDARCPIEQSEQYFVALKRLRKEVELVRFPGCSHLFLRMGHPRMREEYLARALAWFDHHLSTHARSGARHAVSSPAGD